MITNYALTHIVCLFPSEVRIKVHPAIFYYDTYNICVCLLIAYIEIRLRYKRNHYN